MATLEHHTKGASTGRDIDEHLKESNQVAKLLYRPLDTSRKEFRLLKVHAGQDGSPIRCSIRHGFLIPSEIPKYETISYCWGDRNDTVTVYIDNYMISVLASAAAALRRVRSPDVDRTVWIDAICINQQNDRERGQQVAMMSDIYSCSVGNLVYLGEDDDLARTALRSIQAILSSEVGQETYRSHLLRDRLYREPPTPAMAKVLDLDALLSLFSLPWFSRLWVFQEAALAPRNTCILGQTCFSLLDALRMAQLCSTLILSELLNVHTDDGLWNAAVLWEVVDKQDGPFRSGALLSELIGHAWALQSSDPRDRVFGMLGLLRRRDTSSALLVPDYSKTMNNVLHDAIRYCIEEGEPVRWEQLNHRTSRELFLSDLPSWVPRYDRHWEWPLDPVPFPVVNGSYNDKFQRFALACDEDDPRLLLAYGLGLGEVTDLKQTFTETFTEVSVEDLAKHSEGVVAAVRESKVYTSTKHAAVSVLIAKMNPDDAGMIENDIRDFGNFMRALRVDETQTLSPDQVTPATEVRERSAARFHRALSKACYNRRVFSTTQGHVGLGPSIMAEGDITVVAYGSRRPFVLRPYGQEYRLVGPCYVCGVMNGEALEKHKEEGKPDVLFRIR